jgi:glycolate oxidase FAD binding subunit
MMLAPGSVEELRQAVRSTPRLLPRGGGTKDGLSRLESGFEIVDMRSLRGVVEHQPSEFTVTALAGTPIAELDALLETARQYLPFDPLLAASGATVGGTVASGLCGCGRLRYGGIRDFILGIQFVDGAGNDVRAGGRVVKNAAGFDLPKLMVGSLGALGVLTEVTFKVFPRPPAELTLRLDCGDLVAAVGELGRLTRGSFDLDALEIESHGRLWLRLSGRAETIEERGGRLAAMLDAAVAVKSDTAGAYWRSLSELEWLPAGSSLVKVPSTPSRIVALDAAVAGLCRSRRYGAGGQQAWLTCDSGADLDALDEVLRELGLRGLRAVGGNGRVLLGAPIDPHFLGRVRSALDPQSRFRAL